MSGDQSPRRRPTTGDLIRSALIDGIQWQESLAATFRPGAPERRDAQAQARGYREILMRRYGSGRTPMEQAMDGARTVTLGELRRRHEADGR